MSAEYQYGEDKPAWNAEDGTPQAQARRVSGGYNIDPIPDIKPDAISADRPRKFNHEFIDMPREFKPRQQSIISPSAIVNIPITPMAKVTLRMPEEDAIWLRNYLRRELPKEDLKYPRSIAVELDGTGELHALQMHIQEVVIRD